MTEPYESGSYESEPHEPEPHEPESHEAEPYETRPSVAQPHGAGSSPAQPSAPVLDAAEPPAAPETGDTRVDEAVRSLGAVEELPVNEHVGVFTEVHRRLQDTLAGVDGE